MRKPLFFPAIALGCGLFILTAIGAEGGCYECIYSQCETAPAGHNGGTVCESSASCGSGGCIYACTEIGSCQGGGGGGGGDCGEDECPGEPDNRSFFEVIPNGQPAPVFRPGPGVGIWRPFRVSGKENGLPIPPTGTSTDAS